MRDSSFQITKKQYDYLLPIFGNIGTRKLLLRSVRGVDSYYFIGTQEDYIELLNRCKYL